MDNLDSLRLQKFSYGNEIPICRYQHGHVICIRPSQADHVRDDPGNW